MVTNTQAFIGLGLAFVGGTALGGGIGYFVANKRLIAKYEILLEEENARTKEFYARVNKTGDYSDPVTAADKLVADAADAMINYTSGAVQDDDIMSDIESERREAKIFDDTEVDVERVEEYVKRNIFAENGDDLRLNKRDTSKPYVITEDEWGENPKDHDQIVLTYYAGDNVLADDEDGVIEKVEPIVGRENLELFGVGTADNKVVFVRNEKLGSDYEIHRREDKYQVVVLAFDEQEEKKNHIQHSDEPMTRKRRLRDD